MGAIFNLGALYLTTDVWGWYYLYGAVVTNILTMILIFLADKYYTFKHNGGEIHVQFLKYVVVYIASNLSSLGLLVFFVEALGWYYLIGQAIATTLVSFLSFLAFKYWIFHHGIH